MGVWLARELVAQSTRLSIQTKMASGKESQSKKSRVYQVPKSSSSRIWKPFITATTRTWSSSTAITPTMVYFMKSYSTWMEVWGQRCWAILGCSRGTNRSSRPSLLAFLEDYIISTQKSYRCIGTSSQKTSWSTAKGMSRSRTSASLSSSHKQSCHPPLRLAQLPTWALSVPDFSLTLTTVIFGASASSFGNWLLIKNSPTWPTRASRKSRSFSIFKWWILPIYKAVAIILQSSSISSAYA